MSQRYVREHFSQSMRRIVHAVFQERRLVGRPVPVCKVQVIVDECNVFIFACHSYHFIRFLSSFVVFVIDRCRTHRVRGCLGRLMSSNVVASV